MLQRTARYSAPLILFVGTALITVSAGCEHDVVVAGVGEAGPSPSFVTLDAATPDPDRLTAYCPSSNCPAGHTTCPGSYFPCDVDLRTDPNNCGACGAACPETNGIQTFDCVEGRCVLTCNIVFPPLADCNNAPDDGCEANFSTNDNCGACGVKCTDPAKPCAQRSPTDYGCGCPDGLMLCPGDDNFPGVHCADPNSNLNCGACGHVCDKPGEPDNTFYACKNGTCEELKCVDNVGNCDGSMMTNGCETSLLTDANCGACGNACAPGAKCAFNMDTVPWQPFCACPDNKTFCGNCFGSLCFGVCRDLTSDANACGSCNVSCNEGNEHAEGVCVYGSCEQRCPSGRADCNGNTSDGCEVNTKSDPQNCGACGVACDAIAGQACVGGQCVVEPCDQLGPDGGFAR
jgi:hypothetical protein